MSGLDRENAFVLALRKAVKGSGKSHTQLVRRLNRLAEKDGVKLAAGRAKELSVESFGKWLDPHAINMPPVKALPYLAEATGSIEMLRVLMEPLGIELITAIEAAEMGKLETRRQLDRAKDDVSQLANRIRAIEARVKNDESVGSNCHITVTGDQGRTDYTGH
ncbi:hypothetical protein [Magnetococcus sp. PR-3]|uniref:hypothetical protein n=1 Tax=Magnetococcus sp. PR-3 TaxID=3120355 RepID=UPI002FCDE556